MARHRHEARKQQPSATAAGWSRPRWLLGGVGSLLIAAAAVVGLLMFKPWSNSAEPPSQAGRDPSAPAKVPFDAKRAMGYLNDVCKIGTRISGTEGMTKQQEMLQKYFEDLGASVTLQRFSARQRSQADATPMANLIVSWHPDRDRRVILCSHYDTRPLADQEPDERKWHEPFISANDGGSGVALLMELGHAMKDLPTSVGVDFVFFDGEEYVFDRRDQYFFGSEYFARKCKEQSKKKYLGAILLDMVGGKNARFPVEPGSDGSLVEEIWEIALEEKCDAFRVEYGRQVEDDHVPLNRAGIRAIDIIDFSYKHWHRLTDLPENCSGDGMEQVAHVLGVWLQRVK
jgi:hypothetical protein